MSIFSKDSKYNDDFYYNINSCKRFLYTLQIVLIIYLIFDIERKLRLVKLIDYLNQSFISIIEYQCLCIN